MMHVDLQLLMNLHNNKYGATLPFIDSQDQIEIDCCFLIDAFVYFLLFSTTARCVDCYLCQVESVGVFSLSKPVQKR